MNSQSTDLWRHGLDNDKLWGGSEHMRTWWLGNSLPATAAVPVTSDSIVAYKHIGESHPAILSNTPQLIPTPSPASAVLTEPMPNTSTAKHSHILSSPLSTAHPMLAVTGMSAPDTPIEPPPGSARRQNKALHGTPGDDNLHGTSGDDIIYGYGGNDKL